MSCVKQDLIKLHVVWFILSQSSSVVESHFFSNRRVSSRFDIVNASITSHLHIPKFLPSNFTTSIFKGCGSWFSPYMYYLWPSSHFPQSNTKANGVRSKKLDKDRIFTSKWNLRRVSETIYSTESNSLSNANVVLRSTHDLTNSPNAAPRSTHDLRQTATNALGINTRSHDESGMLWYHLLQVRVTTDEKSIN